MTYSFLTNVKPHDQHIQFLLQNSYAIFDGHPVYHTDTYLKPLGSLCDELGNRNDIESNQTYMDEVCKNRFFTNFAGRFLRYENFYYRDGDLLNKIGDLVWNINDFWQLIEVKTSKTDTFTINAESLIQFAKFRRDRWQYIHFLFINTETGSMRMMNLNSLSMPSRQNVDLCFYSCDAATFHAVTSLSPIPMERTNVKQNLNPPSKKKPDLYYRFDFPSMYGYEPTPMNAYIQSIIQAGGPVPDGYVL